MGFNPRSQANSDALSDFVVSDLCESFAIIRAMLDTGELRSLKNPDVRTKVAERSVDLVLSEGSEGPRISVRLSVEHKTIMTAHGKARKNRYGDIIAYSNHMHNHRQDCIAGAIVVVNASPIYENPDGFAKGLERPKFKMERVVADTVRIFTKIPLREEPSEPNDQPEAIGIIVVDYDGTNPANLVTGELSPQPGEPAHYEAFIERICRLYGQRFSGR